MSVDRVGTTAPYIASLQKLLELRDWTVILMDEATDCAGFITPLPGSRRAFLQLHKDFDTETPEEQRHTIVHELLHLHLAETQTVVDADAVPALGVEAGRIVSQTHRRALEQGVDAIATAVARLLPLPEVDDGT